MSIQLWGPLVTSLQTQLQTNLPGIIDNINATETNPSYPIPYPDRVLDYIPSVADMYALPIIGISDGAVTLEDDTGWGATQKCEFSIVVFLQSSDQRTLVWQLRRYAQALCRVALTNRSFGNAWGVTLRQVRPGPTLGRDSDPKQWLSSVAVSIEVKAEADSVSGGVYTP